MQRRAKKPTLAVWKFASCDGCQLSLLDCEDELLEETLSPEVRSALPVVVEQVIREACAAS